MFSYKLFGKSMYIEINGLHEWRTVGVNCSLNMSIQLWLLVLYVVVACSI